MPLGLPLAGEPERYLHSKEVEGSKSFGVGSHFIETKAADLAKQRPTLRQRAMRERIVRRLPSHAAILFGPHAGGKPR